MKTTELSVMQDGPTSFRLELIVCDQESPGPVFPIAATVKVPSPFWNNVNDAMCMLEEHNPSKGPTRVHAELGAVLWNVFCANAVGEALCHSDQLMDSTLLLMSDCTRVLSLPWEYLYDSRAQCFPFYDFRLRFVRCPERGVPLPSPVAPLKVWVCLSCPADRVGFNTLWCKRQVEKEWQDRLFGPYAEIAVEGLCPSSQQFLDAFSQYDVIYFIGHGEKDALILTDCDQRGSFPQAAVVGASEIAARIGQGNCKTKLLILNACRSARVAAEVFRLAASGRNPRLPAIVAMQLEVPVCYAFDLQQHILPRLLFRPGESISDAIARWRVYEDVDISRNPRSHPGWGMPTLFAPRPNELTAEACVGGGDRLAKTQAIVADANPDGPGFGPTSGPIGLDGEQRELVLNCLAGVSPVWRTSLETALGTGAGALPYSQEKEIPPFAIDIYPVTIHLYNWYLEHIDSGDPGEGLHDGPGDHPVRVTYLEAQRFCARMDGRLPTRQEWERAARGNKLGILPWAPDSHDALMRGHHDTQDRLRCNVMVGGAQTTMSVFATDAGHVEWNEAFVADMVGNVPEWTSDGDDPGSIWVMGVGCEGPLVVNIPSYARRVRNEDFTFGFRCVSRMVPRQI